MATPSTHVAALLLTGGSSRRMGRDKSRIVIDGMTLARRNAALLEQVVTRVYEVGPGHSGLVATREDPVGAGPLAAVVAGNRLLRANGHRGAALVIACDLPFLDASLLSFLAEYDAPGTVVPVVDGRAQPLLARWGVRDLDEAQRRYERGERSLRHVTEGDDVTLLDESAWCHAALSRAFVDVDTPEDLARYGLTDTER
ncbi:MAG: molybdenum cofactor guanylyltransferase [Acidimicrobiales bacterium]